MKKERSAMAVVICNNKVLVTYEMIYGNLKVSLPKGHIELNETYLEAAIRETFEETNVIIKEDNFLVKLTDYEINFTDHNNEEIQKIITPALFLITDYGNPLPKEENVMDVKYLEIDDFIENVHMIT